MRPAVPRTPRHQAGFSLVELMIALVLGLILIIGAASVYVTNQQAARTNEGLARLQESGRIAFELMSREMRQAGGNACGATLVANVLNNPSNNWYTDFDAGPVIGYEGNAPATGIVATGTAVGQRVNGTDAIMIMGPNPVDNATIVTHNPTAAEFSLNTSNHGIADGDVVLVCDSQSAAVTQITNAQPGVNVTIVHNTGLGTPGNCTKGLGYPVLCTTNGTPKTFAGGGIVSKLNPGFWYIGNNPRGGRSLYRASSTAQVEITDGVVDMQLQYLTRNATSGNLALDWVDGSTITNWSNAGTELPVAVRVQLSLQSLQNVGTDQQTLNRVQVYSVTLRNRAL
ncbi:prepilin-type N-terminal cleavage/methylation domain-containing protein [Hydrogenophaga intermedia]|uniref:prepilin-type N-terminal cleavage/methylation domain-containing protein n=1 Tax=Hydrogenophaga intermedia TaxID=65786 RepID=UPI00204395D4|nr:prepilin-type N-terminal cleavage/methylation domain-containing protein [Hydrogenophaga intermedia]MCM3562063.1 prepilin-type N-terminal cleavage/methylation domain-containing protein [Hydrogenophaga intermedia]